MTISGTAGATFPDATTQATAARSGSTATSSASDVTLTSGSTQVQVVTTTGAGLNVVLPNATTLGKGEGSFEITGGPTSYAFNIKNGAGDILYGPVFPGMSVQLTLTDNSTSAGTWNANGVQAHGGYGPINVSTVSSNIGVNVNNSGTLRVVGLSSTLAVIFYYSNATTISVVAMSISGTTVTFGTPATVATGATLGTGSRFSAAQISSTQAVCSAFTTATFLFAVSVSGTTCTVGAGASLGTVQNISLINLASGTGLVSYYFDDATTAAAYVRAFTVSTATITLGAVTTLASGASGSLSYYVKSCKTSSNSFLAMYGEDSAVLFAFRAFTFSGTTLTGGTAVNVGLGTAYNQSPGGWFATALNNFYSPANNTVILVNAFYHTDAIVINTSGTTVSSYSGTQLTDQGFATGATYVGFGSSGQALAMSNFTNGWSPMYLVLANSAGVQGMARCFPTNSMLVFGYNVLDTQNFLLAGVTTSGTNSYLTAQILKVI